MGKLSVSKNEGLGSLEQQIVNKKCKRLYSIVVSTEKGDS